MVNMVDKVECVLNAQKKMAFADGVSKRWNDKKFIHELFHLNPKIYLYYSLKYSISINH